MFDSYTAGGPCDERTFRLLRSQLVGRNNERVHGELRVELSAWTTRRFPKCYEEAEENVVFWERALLQSISEGPRYDPFPRKEPS